MSRRPGNPARRLAESGSLPFGGSVHTKSRSSPLLSIGLVVVVISIATQLLHFQCVALFPRKWVQFFWFCIVTVAQVDVSVKEKLSAKWKAKSFSLVIISDALDYLSPRYLNKTLPELARVSSDGVIIFSGYPGQRKAKVAELSKFGRPLDIRPHDFRMPLVSRLLLPLDLKSGQISELDMVDKEKNLERDAWGKLGVQSAGLVLNQIKL
ncbi:hypothetical protein GH714_030507 [Hevea brasiliensis]|uniref:Uncharacterized protein n=1 Tax=Hevea brasiliensis TaxID=3981 RepID=A0A6A6N3P8_HEVBR|nr:hypothetical protein GH714_030507 [Hevea brasiliensis]